MAEGHIFVIERFKNKKEAITMNFIMIAFL